MADAAAAAALGGNPEAAKLKEEGNQAYKDRNFDGAIELYSKAIEAEGESDNAALCYSNPAACYQAKKEWKLCEEDAKMCIKLKPKFSKGYHRLSVALKKQGLLKASVRALADGLKIAPNDAALKKAMVATQKKWMQENQMEQASAKAIQAMSTEMANLQRTYEQHRTQMAQCQGELNRCQTEVKRAAITHRELEKLSDDTPMYRAVGKMFLRSSKKNTESHLEMETEQYLKKIKQSEGQKAYLAKKMASLEQNMGELVKGLQKRTG